MKPSLPGSMTSSTRTSKAGPPPQEQLQRRLAGAHHLHRVAFRLEIEPQSLGQVLLVFHHQYSRHFAIGNSTTNVLPRPGPSLSAQARPPWRLATERTMYSPSPVPFTADAMGPGHAVETLENLLQLRFRNPRALVGDAHGDALLVLLAPHRNARLLSRVLDGVVDQVGDGGAHFVLVGRRT